MSYFVNYLLLNPCLSCTICCKWPLISNLGSSENSPAYDAANEGARKAIASYYRSFLIFLQSTSQYCTCQLFVSQMREIFTFSWPGFPETTPAISEYFRRISEDFQTLPKFKCKQMFRKTLEHFRSYLKTANLACFDCVRTKKRTQSHHIFKNNLSEFVSQAWEIVLDAWDWCFWSSGMMRIQYSEDINFDWLI